VEGDLPQLLGARGLDKMVVGRVDVMEKLARIELDLPLALGVCSLRAGKNPRGFDQPIRCLSCESRVFWFP
jgi:hypothetical protein